METRIKKAVSFSNIGERNNQEDSLRYAQDSTGTYKPWFILCDGMGGHDKGEVASQTVCEALSDYFDKHAEESKEINEDYFNQALDYAYEQLHKKDVSQDTKKMGTTLTCVYFSSEGAWCFHIGDSRIYHIRPSKYNKEEGTMGLMFQTIDHSLVNSLLRAGELTEQEARNYPHKNIITRAMQPNDKHSKADYRLEKDIEPGDYFFLCSDGVLEQLNNEELCSILADQESDTEAKLTAIENVCKRGTKDNHTCILIEIGTANETRPQEPAKQQTTHSEEQIQAEEAEIKKEEKEKKKKTVIKIFRKVHIFKKGKPQTNNHITICLIAIVIILVALLLVAIKYMNK